MHQALDPLVTNLRNPILRLVADSSPGIHDTLIPCCDLVRYHQLGIKGHHASCAENFTTALRGIAVEQALPPAPLNLFMNVPLKANGALAVAPPDSKPGDHVELEAEMDGVVVLSACPHDIFPVNGADCTPKDVARPALLLESEIRASRGAVRMPLPMRSKATIAPMPPIVLPAATRATLPIAEIP